MSRRWSLVLLLLPLLAGGCGSSGDGPGPEPACIEGDGPRVVVSGTVRYERLVLGPSGLGPALEVRPARFVDLRIRLAGGGTCYGEGSTDATGAYSLEVRPPDASNLEVVVYSRTDQDPLRRVTVHDALPPSTNDHDNGDVFFFVSAPFVAGTLLPVDVTVPYNPGTNDRPSIGFGLLDVLITCAEAVREATLLVPPLCHAYTQLGNNGATGTSFYSHAARAVSFLGGAAGNLDGTDTDYFDDAVIAHEYGHFIEFQLSHSLTRGGAHGGEELEPPFAWSEGQATGFGCLGLEDPAYIDTVGTSGGTRLLSSVEDWPQIVRGIGGEETTAEIVWDLGDGAGGIPDADGDVAAVGRDDLYAALLSFDPDRDAPYVGLFLDRLVARGAIGVGDLQTLLLTPEDQQITYPLAGADVWPLPLAVPGQVTGTVTSAFPAVPNPCRALVASRWYVFEITSTRTLTFDLDITPVAGTGDNLDLFLSDVTGRLLEASNQLGGAAERVGPRSLSPGRYLVRVEANCLGAGNEAGFTLTVSD